MIETPIALYSNGCLEDRLYFFGLPPCNDAECPWLCENIANNRTNESDDSSDGCLASRYTIQSVKSWTFSCGTVPDPNIGGAQLRGGR